MSAIVKGKFSFKNPDKKKDKKAEEKQRKLEEKLKAAKADKETKKQCECNHRDNKKHHTHLITSEDGRYRVCQICGGKILSNHDDMSMDVINASVDVVYSVLSYARMSIPFKEKADDRITTALEVVKALPALADSMDRASDDLTKVSKKGKKNKDKKNKNKKHGGKIHRNKF